MTNSVPAALTELGFSSKARTGRFPKKSALIPIAILFFFLCAGTSSIRAAEGIPTIYGYEVFVPPGLSHPWGVISGPRDIIELEGSLDANDTLAADNTYVEFWQITFLYDSRVDISLNSNQIDPFLGLIRVDSTQRFIDLFEDDDSGPGENARITADVQAGTYWIGISTFGAFETGAWSLVMESSTNSRDSSLPMVPTLYGVSVQENPNPYIPGELESSDFVFDGRYVDLYQFEASEDVALQIDLTSDWFDTRLMLADVLPDGSLGTLFLLDEDGGESTNSRISRTFGPGTYFLVATSGAAGAVGEYEISVSAAASSEASAPGGNGVDTFPTFRTATPPGNQMYTVGAAIGALTLPEASGGDGNLTYSLAPDVPGLNFNATERQLTGTPSEAGTYQMTYTVRDADGDTDSLEFTIAVEVRGGDANGRIYVVDRGIGKVYTYLTSGERDAAADFDLDADNTLPVGITFADGRFYVVDTVNDKVYVYTETGQRDAAADFELDEDNTSPGGIAYGEGRLYVIDRDDKVYAYLTSGERDAAADFELDENYLLSSEGIAYAEGRLYVVDTINDKVRAYTVAGQRDATADFDFDYPGRFSYADGRFYAVRWSDYKVYAYTATGQRDASADFDINPRPTFENTTPLADQFTYTTGTAIETLTLPEARGGEGALTYNLSPDVPGLAFDATTRRLTGTPSGSGTYAMTYTVTDEDGDTDNLKFTIVVEEGELRAAGSFQLLDGISGDAEGIAWANDRFYVVAVESTFGAEKVFAYTVTGERDAAADFDDLGLIGPTGITFANGRFYVAVVSRYIGVSIFDNPCGLTLTAQTGHLIAYTETGERDRLSDFDLSCENADPAGIVFAGGQFHVVDGDDAKVYSYALP